MDTLSNEIDDVLVESVLLWTGRRESIFPCRDDEAVVSKYGSERAHAILTRLSQLKKEFYLSDAKFTAVDLDSMGKQAIADFQTVHPDLDGRVAETFAWCYTYDYK